MVFDSIDLRAPSPLGSDDIDDNAADLDIEKELEELKRQPQKKTKRTRPKLTPELYR